ncbi:unnamed protein product [Allacma fusca]|uniref:Uncharacterized protein n=1 Tax=Allacma fusca TaxID=39272 RepID=A0A8J2KYI0_9HEXA|nr:unnamed protein product [Allacma fusca]
MYTSCCYVVEYRTSLLPETQFDHTLFAVPSWNNTPPCHPVCVIVALSSFTVVVLLGSQLRCPTEVITQEEHSQPCPFS